MLHSRIKKKIIIKVAPARTERFETLDGSSEGKLLFGCETFVTSEELLFLSSGCIEKLDEHPTNTDWETC